jgi:diguanylate cyclase (GGDEF)-like protein/PAS domain S-box-containing protein
MMLALALLTARPVQGASPNSPDTATKTLTVGVFAFRPKDIMRERYGPLGEYLTRQMPGYKVEILPLIDNELEDALKTQKVDFVFTNPTYYIKLRELDSLSGALATVVTRQGDREVHGMGGIIVRRADRPELTDIQSLRGHRIAIPGKHYLGTFMAPANELVHSGVDLSDVTFVETRQPVDQVITSVLEGKADAGFLRTGVLEDLEEEGKLKPGQLVVLNPQSHPGFTNQVSTRLYPDWPFLAVSHVDPAISQRVSSALMNLRPEDPAAQAAGIYGFTIPADYSSVEQAMRDLRMKPFEAAPPINWSDVWYRYSNWILLLLALVSLLLMLTLGLVVQRKRLLQTHRQLQADRTQLSQTTERLNYLLDSSPVMLFTLEVTRQRAELTWVSANITRRLGYNPAQARERGWWKAHLHPGDAALAIARVRQLHQTGLVSHSFRFAGEDGQYHWIHEELRLLSSYTPKGHLEALGVWRDVTQERAHEDRLRLAASVFDNSYDGVLITDDTHHIVDVNPAFVRITGVGRSDVLGQTLASLTPTGNEALAPMTHTLVSEGHWQGELTLSRQDSTPMVCAMSVSAVYDNQNQLRHHVVVFSDISHIKRHQQELDYLANYDPLTGIPNRRMLLDRLDKELARARRTHKNLALCYLDLDDFKPINDRLGHALGDQLLIQITRRIQNTLRTPDTLARLGGDEFIILLSDLDAPDEWRGVLDRVLAAVQQPVALGTGNASVSASVGVTVFPGDDAEADVLLRHADQAMYRAKQLGRHRYHLFDMVQDREVQVQREMLTRLTLALDQDELVLFYQPKVDLETGEVVGAEALIRWQHPEHGLLPPAAFLSQLQGSELEIKVGEWVVDTALTQLAAWKTQSSGDWNSGFCASVNVSGQQLLKPGFVAWLNTCLQCHPTVHPHELELEILESAAIADMATAAQVMRDCRALGVRFALDDFGTGYSSLAYFRTLPVDMIKIDQSFVRDMLTDADDQGIVESVVYLAHAFHRPVIAEGVETLEHAAALLRLGCHMAQGYGIARPMHAQALPAWIQQWTKDRAWEDLRSLPIKSKQETHAHKAPDMV